MATLISVSLPIPEVSGFLFVLLRQGETVCVCVCGNAAANSPIVHPTHDSPIRVYIEQRCNHIDGSKPCYSASFSATNFTRIALGANPDLRGEKTANKRLCYGTVPLSCLIVLTSLPSCARQRSL
jgi:hypothetical protein